jgi:hypothetical protein
LLGSASLHILANYYKPLKTALDLSGEYMLAYFKYRKDLHSLNKEAARLQQEYKDAEKSYNGEDDRGHLNHLASQQIELDIWIDYRKTLYFKSTADTLLIPMPALDDTTMYTSQDVGEDSNVNILTLNGIHYLKNKIREEHKAKRDVVAFYFTLCIGLVGAVTGLVSVLKK